MVESVAATESERLYDAARLVLPGGMSAAARLNPALGRPFFAARGEGARLWDVDGREYIDLNTSFGAALLGYRHPVIDDAVRAATELGTLCAFETEHQSALARRITEIVPAAELVRFTGTGTETVWHTIRTARVFTGRQRKSSSSRAISTGTATCWATACGPPRAAGGGGPEPVPESAGMPPAAAGDDHRPPVERRRRTRARPGARTGTRSPP